MEPEKRVRPAIRTAMQMSEGFSEVLAQRKERKGQVSPLAVFKVPPETKETKQQIIKRRQSRSDWVRRKESLKTNCYPRLEDDQSVLEDMAPKLAFSATTAKQLPAIKCIRSEAPSPVMSPSGSGAGLKGKIVLFKPRKMNRGKTGVPLPVLPSSPRIAPAMSRLDPATSRPSKATLLSLKLQAAPACKTPVPLSPPPAQAEAVLQPVVKLLEINSSEFESHSDSFETPIKLLQKHFRHRSEW